MAQRSRHTFPRERRPRTAPFQSTRPFVVKDVHPKVDSEIGRGAYGSVSLYALEGIMCAGKQVHENLASDGRLQVVEKFDKECSVLAKLSHPNVVQFMGMHAPLQSTLPVLLMELLATDLHSLLLNKPNIPPSLKLSFLADVARGLRYLHSYNPQLQIVHRDLSAKNVLLNSTLVAKIGDLGNVRLIDLTPDQASTLSHVPGTPVYMPPEAFEINTETTRRVYDASLDVFSFGHLALFTATQVFPNELLPPKYESREQPRVMLGRSEINRRQRYFEILNQMELQHLNVLIQHCLSDTPQDRPTAEELETELEEMKEQQSEDRESHSFRIRLMKELRDKEHSHYQEDEALPTKLQAAENRRLQSMITEFYCKSEEQLKMKDEQIHELRAEIERQPQSQELKTENTRLQSVITDLCHDTEEQVKMKNDQICQLRTEIEDKESLTRELESQVGRLESQVERLESQVERLESEAEEMRKELAQTYFTSKELDEKNQEIRELQGEILSYEEKIRLASEEQKDQVEVRDGKIKWLHEEMEKVESKLEASQMGPGLYDKFEWSRCADLPVMMEDPQAVLLGGKLYMGGGRRRDSDGPSEICIYSFPVKSWITIDSPVRLSALAVYKDDLVLIGGKEVQQDTSTGQVMTLQTDSSWREQLPPMPTARSGASAVGMRDHLIVVGGERGDKYLDTVEVYNGQIWAIATSLPRECSRVKLLVSGNVLFVIGGLTSSFFTKGRLAMCTKLSSMLVPPTPPTAVQGVEAARRIKTGARVSRGCDWKWDNQDGPLPSEGTVVRSIQGGWVGVQWDSGFSNAYRMGSEDKYDLSLVFPHITGVSWDILEPLPYRYSGIAKHCGSILAVGGFTYLRQCYQFDIHIYVPVSNSWVKIGTFPVPVSYACAIALPSDDIMVIGGRRANELVTQSVFTATISTNN